LDLYTLYHLKLVSAHNGDEPPKDYNWSVTIPKGQNINSEYLMTE